MLSDKYVQVYVSWVPCVAFCDAGVLSDPPSVIHRVGLCSQNEHLSVFDGADLPAELPVDVVIVVISAVAGLTVIAEGVRQTVYKTKRSSSDRRTAAEV